MIYDLLAPIYDEVNKDVDYSRWADFIESIVRDHAVTRPELVLDLGCGTGRMTIELGRRGYDMTGVDISEQMLDVARKCGIAAGLDDRMLWLCQDMCDFELYGTVDLTVCCLDCLNHLTSPADLDRCLSLVHNYLIPDGLFVFDINGRAKFEQVYGNECYVIEQDHSFCVWQNNYDSRSRICDFYITLFNENKSGSYDRFDEVQTERMYTVRAMRSHLERSGFEVIGAYSDFSFTAATDESERIYFAARCKK